ncbi:phosphatase PAP2 family protein [Elizabethkingia meningoseptica]|uniref:Phosphoesterase n=1 Tax=Elizabethkingia meningoseptica TaxID=238 RepID=A0A1V3U2I2_ELIME|nr:MULTISPECIES: phosphatase PAP2 family protein [Elizabethkingia]AQX13753.1 phosphoesterase [Elizabethkingia meningoseptica]EJK5327344.1 phosphatase PAP2 family protein [Elizabethkingia meningoseptica]MBG0515552.1 phosphatase PAP2 family protein [Elizabethkingia meningoseptica]MDE5429858.1 phosphatase PAP2 family protein [Elizabethkingia meningoseptica]MDE5434081.1 phosphatase PAP2 family protein [Elizabethkingia meningoseptica]
MDKTTTDNPIKLNLYLFYIPVLLMVLIVLFLYSQDALNINSYIQIQTPLFFLVNAKLSQYPALQYNLTQFGDALVFLSFLTILIVYAPKVFGALISGSLISALFCNSLKNLLAVPRPAAVLDNNSFVIIGKTLAGHNSLPSGHAITIFTIITVLLFSFMPKKLNYKVIWVSILLTTGLFLAFTRVGVGAHYPLDVVAGSIVGYLSGILGIFINQKYKTWVWINDKRFYPVFILLLTICSIVLVNKLINEKLIIFYLSLINSMIMLHIITNIYVKKRFKITRFFIINKLS